MGELPTRRSHWGEGIIIAARIAIQLLGPITAAQAGARVPVQGQRQLKFLAALALSPDQVVSKDSIIADSWGSDPPRTVSAQVQNSAWMIRRAFEQAGAGRHVVLSHAVGYQLRVAPDRVDLFTFRDMARDARELCHAGDHHGALARLDAALALWKGPALADITSGRLRLRADLLDRERTAAQELRAELDLCLGHFEEAVAQFEHLVSRDPLREDLYERLMRAYQQAGRQADAIAVFHQARQVLADELGILPGRRLTAVLEGILNQRPVHAPA
ncbi:MULTISPECIES: AfsR/SARP family transcriptional regulator [unclassified Streptomyces]|uniref:AfsR/SARP family transcriptional regulator n=1 Tax=unclassified Streptomyces TaxID=2593676 RepID=UPI001F5B09A2|nr:BTAD domain-containing putative transcriptional regulator [Streptomyces sp. HSG2]